MKKFQFWTQKESEKFVLTLWKSYNEDEVNNKESQQVCPDHFIDHNNKRSDDFEPSEKKYDKLLEQQNGCTI